MILSLTLSQRERTIPAGNMANPVTQRLKKQSPFQQFSNAIAVLTTNVGPIQDASCVIAGRNLHRGASGSLDYTLNRSARTKTAGGHCGLISSICQIMGYNFAAYC
jgi:hypothetical protein